MDNYYDEMELEDYNKLVNFNNQLHWFTSLTPTKKYDKVDAVGIDKKGRKISIELKSRDGQILDYKHFGDVLVEPKKLNTFTDIMESGYTLGETCLYINFVEDGIIAFNFNDIDNIRVIPNHKHYNKGTKQYEFETRFALPLNKAFIYAIDEGEYYRIQ